MDPLKNYLKYSKGLFKRSKQIGFFRMLKEYKTYYNKFSELPFKMGFKADSEYKLFVLYNYIKITYFLWDESTEYILKFIPRRIQKYLLPKINPLDKKYIVVDKVEFYKRAKQKKLPIPETYFYTKNGKVYSLEGETLYLEDFKYLDGVVLFSKIVDGSAAVGAKKEKFVFDIINLDEYRIYQKALHTHKEILALSPTKALNCIKISSYLKKNGEIKIQLSFIKLGGENSIVDNIGGKSGGGIAIPINHETGELKGVGYLEVGDKLRVSKIPSNNNKFEGFVVPYYNEAVDLVKKAHKEVFHELKHIGWDIGITDNGPILIEANSGADTFAAQMFCRPFNYYDDVLIQENLLNAE